MGDEVLECENDEYLLGEESVQVSRRGEERKFIWHAVIVSLASGAYYGLNAGIISGIGRSIVVCDFFPERDEHGKILNVETGETSLANGLLVGSILVGAMLGSFFGVPLADRAGRVVAFQVFGGLGLTILGLPFLQSFQGLLVLRMIAGLPIGALCSLAPLYVTESVPERIQGSVGTVLQISIAGCLFMAQFLNYILFPEYDPKSADPSLFCVPDKTWRIQLGIGVLPAAALILHSLMFLPESPKWRPGAGPSNFELSPVLLSSSPSPSLRRSSASLNSSEQVQRKIFSWGDLFMTKEGLFACFIGVGLAVATMLTGMDAIMFFSPLIFGESGIRQVTLFTVIFVGLGNWICVFIATAIVDRVGTRPLMIAALLMMTLACFLLFISYALLDEGTGARRIFGIGGVLLFILGFEIGPGPLFFFLAAASFPEHIRPRALVFTNLVQWICNLAVAFFFPFLITAMGAPSTFLLLAVICACSLIFSIVFLQESKKQNRIRN